MDEMPELGDDGAPYSESPSLRQSASILEYLERANLFLVPLDDERIWYRYHHLFADLLRARLHQAQPDLVPLLHIRASAWLEQKGFISEAIHHLFAAQEIGRAADLIERYGPARLADERPFGYADGGQPSTGNDPCPAQNRSLPGLASHHPGSHRKSPPAVEGPWRSSLPAQTPIPDSDGCRRLSHRLWLFLPRRQALRESDPLPDYQALDEIPADELILRNAADFLYGMALARRGELDRAVEVSLKCIQQGEAGPWERWLSPLWPPS